jgi:hypothetical protein
MEITEEQYLLDERSGIINDALPDPPVDPCYLCGELRRSEVDPEYLYCGLKREPGECEE